MAVQTNFLEILVRDEISCSGTDQRLLFVEDGEQVKGLIDASIDSRELQRGLL